MIDVYVASTNKTKLQAVYNGLVDKYPISIYGINCSSNVNEQPIGNETFEGANNRMSKLKPFYSQGLCISIENGVYLEDDKVYDRGTIIFRYNNIVTISTTDIVYFPKEYYQKSLETNFKVTCGSIMEKELDLPNGTWFENFGEKSRLQLLEKTISNTNLSLS